MADLGEDLVTAYDGARLDARYWISIALGISTSVFDYFDYYLVGFLVAVLAPQWQLTFGQTSLILLSAGVGAILGSRTGRARLRHPALGQNFTPSPTARRAQACSGVRAQSARKDAGVDRSRPCDAWFCA
jgi:hypothetical protein